MPDYPHRLRLHGGRNTHAARPIPNAFGETALLTACGYTNGPRDELKQDDAPVTCRNCAQKVTR
jgi:hypothetical protein